MRSAKTRRWLHDDSDFTGAGAAGAIVISRVRKYFLQQQQQQVVQVVRVSSSQAAGTVYAEPNKHGQRVTCPTAIVPVKCRDPGAAA